MTRLVERQKDRRSESQKVGTWRLLTFLPSYLLTFLFTVALLMGSPTVGLAQLPSDVQVTGLRCEYLADPLGIDVVQPRLSWKLQSQWRGQRQTGYQVLVASDRKLLGDGKADLWDSGKVASDQSIHVIYAGKPLLSRTRCYWKVRVWDKDDKPTVFSNVAAWEMGLLAPGDWQAKWISARGEGIGTPKRERSRLGTRPTLEPRAGCPRHERQGAAAGAAVSQGVHLSEAAGQCAGLHLRLGLL